MVHPSGNLKESSFVCLESSMAEVQETVKLQNLTKTESLSV